MGAGDPTSARLRLGLVQALTKKSVIRSESVRDAFLRVPREAFIPEVAARQGLRAAYRDEAFPTKIDAEGMALSSCSQPGIVAEMLELAQIEPEHRILEIGAGTGYNAALLARLAGRVASIEVDRDTAERAKRALAAVGAKVNVVVADGREGLARAAPFDRIIATASSADVPRAWYDQLVDGGLLVMPLRLSESLPFRQVVITLKKEGDRLTSTSVVPGGFMRMRSHGDHVSLPWPESTISSSESGSRVALATLSGQSLGGLTATSRRRLLRVVLTDPAHRPLGMRLNRDDQFAFEAFVALAAPEHRLVGFLRPDLEPLVFVGTCLPAILEPAGRGLAVLAGRTTIGRIDIYGSGTASEMLRRLADDWRQHGRPTVGRLQVDVTFGSERPRRAWKVLERGDARFTFEWAR